MTHPKMKMTILTLTTLTTLWQDTYFFTFLLISLDVLGFLFTFVLIINKNKKIQYDASFEI